jgi:hypothetical protein
MKDKIRVGIIVRGQLRLLACPGGFEFYRNASEDEFVPG